MTETSRRALLRAGASALFLAPFAWARPAAAGFSTTTTGGTYARSRFTPMLNRSLRLYGPTGNWPVTLTSISDLTPSLAGSDKSFGLTFRSSVAGPPQGTYSLRGFRFTTTSLFVVPSPDLRTYQAVINNAF
jgi:hypothetical protein